MLGAMSAFPAPPREARAVAVQPQWYVSDYLSRARFEAWMRAQLEMAKPHLAPDKPNLVVLTELNGLPLLLRGAFLASRAPTLTAAIALALLKHLPSVLYLSAREKVGPVRGLHLALSARTARVYLGTCRDLAREYGVYLACGTAPLPHFAVKDGNLVPLGGQVYNEAVLLAPDGALIGTADKVYLTSAEGKEGVDLSPGALADLRVFPTPAGDLGVATSLDAFKPDLIAHLERQGATVLLQPDANGAAWTAREQEPPSGRDQPLAWLDSAWAAVHNSSALRYAVNPMVVGNLFDVPFDGQSAIVARPGEAPHARGYVMTDPRPGFLALMPWVARGTDEELRQIGRELAPKSGSPRENAYRTGVLAADMHLPPQAAAPEALRPHEQALSDFLSGQATLRPEPLPRILSVAWPAAWVGLTLLGLRQLRRGRKRGAALLLIGAVMTALSLG